MATKPTVTVAIRAADTNYTTGPAALVGTVTKIAPLAADNTEGLKVDSPLGTFPALAQHHNFWHNRTDQWNRWVELGTSNDDADTHIVETDANGEISAVEGEFTGDVLRNVTLDVTKIGGGPPNSGSQALRVQSDEGATGVDIDASFGTGNGLALNVKNNGTTQTAIINNNGDGTALLLTSVGSQTLQINNTKIAGAEAVFIQSTQATTGGVRIKTLTGVPLALEAQVTEPPAVGISGGVWVKDNTKDGDALKARLDDQRMYVQTGRRKLVAAYVELASGSSTSVTPVDVLASFGLGAAPDVSMFTIVIISAEFRRSAGTNTLIGTVEFFDETNDPGTPLRTFTINRDDNNRASEIWRFEFIAPAGARTFKTTVTGQGDATISWDDLIMTVRAAQD